jgi:dTMP kinase
MTELSYQARFIVLEGGEGVGKTLLAARLTQWLATRGITLRNEREPGSTKVGEVLRPILKSNQYAGINEYQALAGFSFARTAYIYEVVQPTLASGTWLLSDRYAFSTLVYQGLAGGVPFDVVKGLTDGVVGNYWPDLTLILDCPVEVALKRRELDGSDGTRYEDKGTEFHQKIRAGYLKMLELYPDKTAKIDASQTPDQVFAQATQALAQRFNLQL